MMSGVSSAAAKLGLGIKETSNLSPLNTPSSGLGVASIVVVDAGWTVVSTVSRIGCAATSDAIDDEGRAVGSTLPTEDAADNADGVIISDAVEAVASVAGLTMVSSAIVVEAG